MSPGANRQGLCSRAKNMSALRTQIMEQLLQLRDPATGEAVVEAVYRREELYAGDYVEQAPDIVFMPTRLEYFGFGEYEFGSHKIIEAMERGISGTHRLNGVFLAYGAGIEPGSEPLNASLVDLAPTILYLMGVPVPAQMDGRILQETIAPDFTPFAGEETIRWASEDGDDADGQGLTEDQRRVVAERLRGLGYVG